ncbi:MAG: sugar transferase [Planctomycetales bacterium]|nr:sugar transferase [Planctomycetales bacterium]
MDVKTTMPASETTASARPHFHQQSVIDVIQPRTSKRIMDICVATLLLVLLSPLLITVALLIKIASPKGSIFFVQERVGWRGETFSIFKFRTMRQNVDTEQHRRYVSELAKAGSSLEKPEMTSRLIWLGGFYRSTAIDELPQLLNILRGEMSLVGPRPDVLALDDYEPWQRNRFAVLPGLTGLWQVSGKNRLTFDQMIELDLDYVKRQSLLLDVNVLLRTPIALVTM